MSGCAHSGRPPEGHIAIVATDWLVEAESPDAKVSFSDDHISIDTPAGLSLWYRNALAGPVRIRFEAMAVSEGGANDQVSDLNAFWMARNADGTEVLTTPRSGAFADYDTLKTYYVGIGGNRNSSTRMRRYVGQAGDRPMLPQHDRSDPESLLVANQWTAITLVADGSRIAVERDGALLFEMLDKAPYRSGHFAFRTTWSHWKIRNVRVERLEGSGQ